MEVLKRKANGTSNGNGQEKKNKKQKKRTGHHGDEQDEETMHFESELSYHSTVTRMKVGRDACWTRALIDLCCR